MNDIPIILEDFLNYLDAIKGKSNNTIKEYYYDLRNFFRYMKIRFKLEKEDVNFNEIIITDIDEDFIKRIKLQDIFAYISYVGKKRSNSNRTKARKIASIRSLFKYLHNIAKIIEENPAENLETPKIGLRHPEYLSLEEAKRFIGVIDGQFKERDYAIVILFLNCGLRISELVSIDINKIKDDTLTVVGKGDKERTVYLNASCVHAINDYLKVRPTKCIKDKNALFISKRKNRISVRAVQHMVKKYIKKAGLDPQKYSVHKLRHTAATLMYKHGNVDIRALQQILGHTSVATTQIYTHLDDDKLRQAVNSNPLSSTYSKYSNKTKE